MVRYREIKADKASHRPNQTAGSAWRGAKLRPERQDGQRQNMVRSIQSLQGETVIYGRRGSSARPTLPAGSLA